MNERIEVIGALHIVGTTANPGMTVNANWPGGAGKLTATVSTATGSSAKLNILQVVGDDFSYAPLADGLAEITSSIVADVIAPRSKIQFQCEIADGDEFQISDVALIRC